MESTMKTHIASIPKKRNSISTIVTAGVIFVLALILRLPYIHEFLTADEINGASMTSNFLMALINHEWAKTGAMVYPSVTTSWLEIIGLVLQWIFVRPADVSNFTELAVKFQANPLDMDILAWARIGMILFAALCTVILWWLVQKLFGNRTAWLATGILLFDPILLGYTRLTNVDPPLIHLLAITWLLMLWGVQSKQTIILLLSGVAFGLAILTKTPALFLGPLILLWIFWQHWQEKDKSPQWLRSGIIDFLKFGLPALVVTWLLWPSLWVNPVGTLQRVGEFTFTIGVKSHELGNFWLGKPRDPGMLFYPIAFLWRTTPVTLIGVILAIIAFLKDYDAKRNAGALFVAVIWYGAILTLSPKKFDRYLFPTFPLLDILAAWGWWWLLDNIFVQHNSPKSWMRAHGASIAAILLIVGQGIFAAINLPTYTTAYNPLVGGLHTAKQVMLVGWGEGLEEAAQFLNARPNAEKQRTASWYGHNVFQPFYRGKSYATFYGINSANDAYAADIDYIVTYINQIQRNLLDESIRSQLSQPLMVSQKNSVVMASVYAWPKPFAHTTDQVIGPGLRLLGWEIAPFAPESGQLQITLFWDADQMTQSPPPIHVWMKDDAGDVWARTEKAQTPNLTQQTQAWLERKAIVQNITLTPPPGLLPGPYRMEMAPEQGDIFLIETFDVPATRASEVTDIKAHHLDDDVLFDDAISLIGYNAAISKQALKLELLWEAHRDPPAGVKYFVHAVDANDEIIAQSDGELGALPGHAPVIWSAGDLLRQHIAIPLPENLSAEDDIRVYVGLYRMEDGQRLPLKINNAPAPDGRYLLMSFARLQKDNP